MAVLDKKVQLEILDEVNEKSDGENPVKIDLTDSVRRFNADVLCNEACFDISIRENKPGKVDLTNWIFGLSKKGHKYLYELARELENIEHVRRQTEAFEEANRKADEANNISRRARFWAALAAIGSAVAAIVAFFALLISALQFNSSEKNSREFFGSCSEATPSVSDSAP